MYKLIVLVALISCKDSAPVQTKPITPECSVTVTREEATAVVKFTGVSAGDGKLTATLQFDDNTAITWNFDVTDKFDFETKHPIPKDQGLIPMTFMFTGKDLNQHVCRLNFVHTDGSALTDKELDGVKRTNTAVDKRQKLQK